MSAGTIWKVQIRVFLLMLNIVCTLGGKAFIISFNNWFSFSIDDDDDDDVGVTNSAGLQLIIRWILTSIVPQILFVSTYLSTIVCIRESTKPHFCSKLSLFSMS